MNDFCVIQMTEKEFDSLGVDASRTIGDCYVLDSPNPINAEAKASYLRGFLAGWKWGKSAILRDGKCRFER